MFASPFHDNENVPGGLGLLLQKSVLDQLRNWHERVAQVLRVMLITMASRTTGTRLA